MKNYRNLIIIKLLFDAITIMYFQQQFEFKGTPYEQFDLKTFIGSNVEYAGQ